MSVLTQWYQCGTWFVCSILRELAVSNLGQPLFCLSITWSRYRNAYRDLWIMTIAVSGARLPSVDGLTVRYIKKCTTIKSAIKICLRFISNLFSIHVRAIQTYRDYAPVPTGSSVIYITGLTLVPAWISKCTHHKMWDEIIYPFPNFNGFTIEVWE